MFISKFWTILLTIALGGLLSIALLAKDVINRERQDSSTELLFKEMTKTDIALNLHARKRLDVLLSISGDGDVRRLLKRASSSANANAETREQLLNILRTRNKALGKYSADMLIAVDRKGAIVAQVGKNERQHSHLLAGHPLVDSALRGYVRDDVWKIENDVFMMAARPVIDGRRYVGAVLHALRVNDTMATEISPTVQMAFFAGNVPVAVGTPKNNETKRLRGSSIVSKTESVLADEFFKTNGYSKPQTITTQAGDEYLVLYSKIRGEASKNNVGYALAVPIAQMASWTEIFESAGSQDVANLPLALIIICVLLASAFGVAAVWFEGGRPLTHMIGQVKDLEQADPKDHLNIYQFRRKYRKLAGAINAVFNAKAQAMGEMKEGRAKSIDSILGVPGDARLSTASMSFPNEEVPAAPPAAPAPAAAGTPPAAPRSPGAPPAPPGAASQEQVYFRKVYGDCVGLKKRLGEPVDQLTYEKFELTLKKNREAIVSRYNCTQVHFQVYEKDGKAALRATPA